MCLYLPYCISVIMREHVPGSQMISEEWEDMWAWPDPIAWSPVQPRPANPQTCGYENKCLLSYVVMSWGSLLPSNSWVIQPASSVIYFLLLLHLGCVCNTHIACTASHDKKKKGKTRGKVTAHQPIPCWVNCFLLNTSFCLGMLIELERICW